MYVLERALGYNRLAVAFAFLTAVAAFGIGNMVQANSIASLAQTSLGVPLWLTGVVLTCLTALVIVRGIHSIASVSQRLVPFMAAFFVLGCLVLLGIHAERIPETIGLILRSAFDGHAAVGGFAGAGAAAAMRFGIARGLFSNEAGMGSAAIVAAAAQTRNPVRQALVSSTGVFWDTVVVCAITGATLVNSGHWTRGLNGVDLTRAAFAELPVLGPFVLNVGLLTFVFSTIIGWSYYGEKAVEYLFGPAVVPPYRWLWVAAVMLGSVASLPVVWSFADIANGLMAIPNLIALLLLTRTVVAETRREIRSA
jgi:AGCS family alanine or glycine:cation symporter